MTELLAFPLRFAYKFARHFASHEALVAENLFLRQQLKLYIDRGKKPRRATDRQRLKLVFLSKIFDWRDSLVIVKPETLLRWHRKAFRLFWTWKSRTGRPPIPAELRRLIGEMATDNPLWGEERIASASFSSWESRSRPGQCESTCRRLHGREAQVIEEANPGRLS